MNLATLTACATCGYTLTKDDHNGHVTFQHPVSDTDRHQPVPVPAERVANLFHRCHICSGPHPVWNYRTGLIGAVDLDGGEIKSYNTQWDVCYPCALFIEADDSEGLTNHSAAVIGWRPSDARTAQLRILHRAIVVSREPERTLLTTTDWPTGKIAPGMLPKIRDRLTGLFRGPALLPEPINDPGTRRHLADELDRSPLYWINHEFTDLIRDVASTQPWARVTERIVPSPSGLVSWTQPVGDDQLISAISWTPHDGGWHILCYRSIGGGLPDDVMPTLRHEIGWLVPIHTEHIPYDSQIPGRYYPIGPLVTTWLLIAQQVAETTPAKLPTAVRKAYQRSQRKPPDVRLVRIKPRPQSSDDTAPAAGGVSGRAKPDHRYWVTGHPRNQAYGPGRTLRKKIDIDPFLKGPEDAPIKLSTTVRLLGQHRPDTNSTE